MRTVRTGDDEAQPLVELSRRVDLQDLKLHGPTGSIRFRNDVLNQPCPISLVLVYGQDIDLTDPDTIPFLPDAQKTDVLVIQVNNLEFFRFEILYVQAALKAFIPSPDLVDIVPKGLSFYYKAEIGIS